MSVFLTTCRYMAADELRTIGPDKWDSEVWGSPSDHFELRFLFGQTDHWVANEARDAVIASRAYDEQNNKQERWRPRMEIQELKDGEEIWDHGFCIRHSMPVAEKCMEYIEEIVRLDIKRRD